MLARKGFEIILKSSILSILESFQLLMIFFGWKIQIIAYMP